jgi:hypothetical protein
MRKFAFSLLACLAISQSAFAATSALTESLLEYEAITSFIGDPSFDVIGPSEFIVDIKRITRDINILGTVEYRIVTRVSDETGDFEDSSSSSHSHRHGCHHHHHNVYIAVLEITPNPGIGPNIVEVISITQVHNHH